MASDRTDKLQPGRLGHGPDENRGLLGFKLGLEFMIKILMINK